MSNSETTIKINHWQSAEKLHRMQVERSIIGAVLLESRSVIKIIDVLEAKNFTGINAAIWSAVITLFEQSEPIDMRTVLHRVLTQPQADIQDIAAELTSCIALVNSSANIESHAFQLLEIGIVDQFLRIYMTANPDEKTQVLIKDILEVLHTEGDKLKMIDDATHWINQVMPDTNFAHALTAFNKQITARAEQIKQRTRLQACISQLQAFSSPKSSFAAGGAEINELASLLITVINERRVPMAFTSTLFQLRGLLKTQI